MITEDVFWNVVYDLKKWYQFDGDELVSLLRDLNDRGKEALEGYVEYGDSQAGYTFMDQLEAQAEWEAEDGRISWGTQSFVMENSQKILDQITYWASEGLFW